MDKKKVGGIVVMMLFAFGILMLFYQRHRFMENYKFTTGIVTEITGPGYESSGDYSILYDYRVGNKIYSSNTNYEYCNGWNRSQIKLLLVGKQFPVVYSPNVVGIGSIVLTQKNADRFHYQLPDSVRYYDSVLTCKP
jgi:hypothetical protein